MSCLPFLVPLHQAPVASLPSEFLALVLGCLVLLATALRRGASPLPLPPIALAPLLLAALILLQYALGMFAYGASALLPAVFLLWSCGMACAGRDAAGDDPGRLCNVLAAWLLAGALANAAAGLLQFVDCWQALGGLVAAPPQDRREGIYGNLAQQNHFASHLALGMAGLAWLWQSQRMRTACAAACAALLLVALALSGSRSGWLYLAVLGMTLLYHAPPARRKHLAMALALAALLLAILALAAWHDLLGTQLARLTRLGAPLGPRTFIWSHAWQMALAHPWLGVGWDGFAASLVGQLRPAETVWGIDQYAHNLFLQLLAAGGLAALLALLLPLGWHLRRSAGAPMLCWAVSGILAVHSMLEQPLYYAYFLGPAAFVAGAMARTSLRPAAPGRLAMAVLAVVLLIGAVRGVRNYHEIRAQVYEAAVPPTPALVQRLHHRSVFAPLLELALPEAFMAADAPVAQRLAFNDKVRHFAPIAEVEFRHAVLLAEAGQQQAAKEQLQRAARAYPAETPTYLARIIALGEQSRFTGLAQAARQLER